MLGKPAAGGRVPHGRLDDELVQRTAERRGESPDQVLDRNLAELLQELRVAQTGTQFLLAFLLAVAFTDRYQRESGFVHAVHLTDVVVTAAADLRRR